MPKSFNSYIWWIAWRNLVSKKRHGLSFMTAVSVGGVAIGVSSLIIVLSVMGGFEADLKHKLLRGDPHLEIVSKDYAAGFSLLDFSIENISKIYTEAVAINPYTKSDVIIKSGEQVAGGTLLGIGHGKKQDSKEFLSPWLFDKSMVEGDFEPIVENVTLPVSRVFVEDGKEVRKFHKFKSAAPPILLGVDLANHLNLNVGSDVMVLSPQSNVDGMLGGNQLVHRFVVAGIFQTEFSDYDNRGAIVSIEEGRKFLAEYDVSLETEKYVTGVALSFPDPMNLDQFERLPKNSDLRIVHWRENNKAILFALKLEKYAMGSILMLIVIVAAFSISGTLIMTVYHRRGQVALFRAIGMSKAAVGSLYVAYGLVIGLVGILAGLVLGLGVCYLLQSFKFLPMPEGVFYLTYVPVKFLPFDYVVICFSACLLSLIAAIYPALAAARGEPSQGLRCL